MRNRSEYEYLHPCCCENGCGKSGRRRFVVGRRNSLMARTKAAHPGQSRREPRKTVRKRPRPERETAAVKRQRKQETQAAAQERKQKEWEEKWAQCKIVRNKKFKAGPYYHECNAWGLCKMKIDPKHLARFKYVRLPQSGATKLFCENILLSVEVKL